MTVVAAIKPRMMCTRQCLLLWRRLNSNRHDGKHGTLSSAGKILLACADHGTAVNAKNALLSKHKLDAARYLSVILEWAG